MRVDGKPVQLTSTEYHLLEVLVQHAGTVLPHHLLLEQVWGPEYVHDTHYLKVFIRRLRQKVGYRLPLRAALAILLKRSSSFTIIHQYVHKYLPLFTGVLTAAGLQGM